MLEETTPADPRDQAIVVDAMGGDNGPAVVVAGAAAAAATLRTPVILTGRPADLRGLVAGHQEVAGLLQIAPAEDTIAMDEGALASWRRPRSSVAVACQLVRRGQAAAVVSAGSTAGVVATGRLRLRSVPGLLRPALVVMLPTRPRPTFLLDAGAIADPKPEMLVQFAQLGVAYAQIAHNIPDPKVGLLTIGAEPGKGNKLARRAHELLAAPPPHGTPPIRFTGNVEGTDLLGGTVDVIVTDGFTGNVALKTLEGAIGFAAGQMREVLGGSRSARLGGVLQRRGAAGTARADGHRDLRRCRPAGPGGNHRHRPRRGQPPGHHVGLPARRGPGQRPDHRADPRAARSRPRRPLPPPELSHPCRHSDPSGTTTLITTMHLVVARTHAPGPAMARDPRWRGTRGGAGAGTGGPGPPAGRAALALGPVTGPSPACSRIYWRRPTRRGR